MKKLIFISALALTLLSCSEDGNSNGACNCGEVVEKSFFNSAHPFTNLRIKNNCTGKEVNIQVDGNQGIIHQQFCY